MQRTRSIVMLLICSLLVFLPGQALATSVSDYENQQEDINQQQSEIDQNIGKSQAELDGVKKSKEETETSIKQLDQQIADTSEKIRSTTDQINQVNDDIAKLETDIVTLQDNIVKRDQIIRERLVLVQENGWESRYAEVIFGASSFGEFVERMDAVSALVTADQDIIEAQVADQKKLTSSKADLEKNKEELSTLNSTYQNLESELDGQKKQKEQTVIALTGQQHEIESYIVSQTEADAILAGQEAAIAQLIAQEEAAAAAAAAEAAANNNNSGNSNGGSGGSGGSGGGGGYTPPPTNGSLMVNPAAGTVTSGFGSRSDGFHYGIDIGNKADVPIYATADGVVSKSYYSDSYGNCVIIAHRYNGKTYSTLYAHMQNRYVSTGDTVSQGQQIGIMGMTGQAQGQHLHFELMNGGWQANHANCFDPMPYLNY